MPPRMQSARKQRMGSSLVNEQALCSSHCCIRAFCNGGYELEKHEKRARHMCTPLKQHVNARVQ